MLKGIFGKIMAKGTWTMATTVSRPGQALGLGGVSTGNSINVTTYGGGGGMQSQGGFSMGSPMTQIEADALMQQRIDEDNRRREIIAQRMKTDGAAGIWGMDKAPRCHSCPLYTPSWRGDEGACMKGGAGVTRPRESYGCETHPEIQAVMRLRIEQATVEFVARKITGGE